MYKLCKTGILSTQFSVARIHSPKTWKQPRCPSTDERIEKKSGIYVYIMAYYFALKKEILPLSTTEMDLKSIMLSEISQSIETGLTSRVSESAI